MKKRIKHVKSRSMLKGKWYIPVHADIGHVKPTKSPAPPEPGKRNGQKYCIGDTWICKRSFAGDLVTIVSSETRKKKNNKMVLVRDSAGNLTYISTKYLRKPK